MERSYLDELARQLKLDVARNWWIGGLVFYGLTGAAELYGELTDNEAAPRGLDVIEGAVIALLGPMVARALLFPLFYAFFMVPFGEEIVPHLQLVTAHLSMMFLTLVPFLDRAMQRRL